MERPTRREVARTFDAIADEFDRTRERPWPEAAEFIDSLPPRSAVVDLGCGNGRHAEYLAEKGHRVVGLDASGRLLAIARHRVPRAAFIRGDLCALPFRDRAFTAAIAVASIHHLPSEAERIDAMREIARVLRPGGRAFVTAWALEQPRFHERLKDRTDPGDAWVPWRAGGKEVPRFYHLFADGELRDLILKSGLSVEKYFRSGENYAAVAERHG
jgi:tRNA (uracil-5-)-methyltransferase TRM9